MDATTPEIAAGAVYFLARGHLVALESCPRGAPPKGATKWCVAGQVARGWIPIEDYGAAARGAATEVNP
jgi:Tfp pilus assembly protein FimT